MVAAALPRLVVHELKCWPGLFDEVHLGRKNFELRKADRDYRIGDTLWLREWSPLTEAYSGRDCWRRIGYLLPGGDPASGGTEMIKAGHVAISLISIPRELTAEYEAMRATARRAAGDFS